MKGNGTIGVIAPTVSKAGNIFLGNLLETLAATHDRVYLISGSSVSVQIPNVQFIYLDHQGDQNLLKKISGYIWFELKIARTMISLSKKVNTWILFMGGESLLLPSIVGKLSRKKIYLLMGGSIEKEFPNKKDLTWIPLIGIRRLNIFFSEKIILYSEGLINQWHLERYVDKICIAHRHFINFNTFTITIPLYDRPKLIGYIGRLSEEKGIENFVQALPEILRDHKNLRVIIGGDGPLMDSIVISLNENKIRERVEIVGWISHEVLPQYLNQLRLLVLPSYTEGLPNIILEAMSCGTPVLATPVGAIPDIVKDGDTGFIISDNSPVNIARNVNRVLNSPDLLNITETARRVVKEEFTFEHVVDKWKGIFE